MSGVDLALLDRLYQPTPDDQIQTRQGPGGRMLSYVDARYVMDKLDELGPENWQRRHNIGADGKVSCDIGIRIDDEWVWKGDGAGETDIEGSKGSFSDAFKRAAVNWGIARDLYSHRAGASSPARPALSPAALTPSAAGDEPPWPANTPLEQKPIASLNPGKCPLHNLPWSEGKFGWYCKSRAEAHEEQNARGYCVQKPTKAWIARQEVVA